MIRTGVREERARAGVIAGLAHGQAVRGGPVDGLGAQGADHGRERVGGHHGIG